MTFEEYKDAYENKDAANYDESLSSFFDHSIASEAELNGVFEPELFWWGIENAKA